MAQAIVSEEDDSPEDLPEPTASADLKINVASGEVVVSADGSERYVRQVVKSTTFIVGAVAAVSILGIGFGSEHPELACLIVATLLIVSALISRKA